MFKDLIIGIKPIRITSSRRRSVLDDVEELSAPINLAPPAIAGQFKTGETLVASTGTWSNGGSPITSFDFQWYRDGNLVSGASDNEYITTEADADSVLEVEVIATNAIGFAVAYSDPTGVIVLADTVPVNEVIPTIGGVARSGETLAATSNGEWSGNGEELLDFEYQWLADDLEMPGKTGTTLALTDNEIGKRISLRVTATNSIGSTSATSLKTSAVIAAQFMPAIVTAPQLEGTAKVGQTLTLTDGVWNNGGSTITSYTYAWYFDEVLVDGKTDNSLLLGEIHEGVVIRAEVTATNGVGSITATTTSRGPVAPLIEAPVNTLKPNYESGFWKAGKTRIGIPGTWNDGGEEIVLTYQWYNVTDDVPIEGETSLSYTVPLSMIGKRVRLDVTATNSAGSITESAPTSQTIANGDLPVKLTNPTLTGDNYVGSTLTATTGTWDGVDFPILGYTYQWQARIFDGVYQYVDIEGETGDTYVVGAEHEGNRIRCMIGATNACGTRTAASPLSLTIQPEPSAPVNTVLPVISGEVKNTGVLSVTTGTWTGSPAPTFSYQWYVDDVAVPGATLNTFTLTGDHVGFMVYCVVTATNPGDSVPATAEAVGPVSGGEMPFTTVQPEISGILRVGFTLTGTDGTWTEDDINPIDSYSRQWYADDVAIVGATGSTYELTEDELGALITFGVTAHTGLGDVEEFSAATAAVQASATAPVNTVLPTVSPSDPGTTTLMTSTVGTWTNGGGTEPTFAYQWLANGEVIPGATNDTLQLDNTFIGASISLRVTATNDVGSTDATSLETDPIAGSLEPETLAYIAAMEVEPSVGRKGLLNVLISSLKSSGVYAKLDVLAIHAAHHQQAARINIIDPEIIATENGTVDFTVDFGYTGNNSDFQLDWGIAPADMAQLGQDSATYAVYPVDNLAAPSIARGALIGVGSATTVRISAQAGATASNFCIHATASSNQGGIADQRGLIGAIRRDSTTTYIRHRKTEVGTHTRGSVAAPITNLTTLRWGTNFGLSTVAATICGAQLSDTEWNDLSDALDAFMVGIGVDIDA